MSPSGFVITDAFRHLLAYCCETVSRRSSDQASCGRRSKYCSLQAATSEWSPSSFGTLTLQHRATTDALFDCTSVNIARYSNSLDHAIASTAVSPEMWGMMEGIFRCTHYVIIKNEPTRGASAAKLNPSQHHSPKVRHQCFVQSHSQDAD
jgi:hypothetical protein